MISQAQKTVIFQKYQLFYNSKQGLHYKGYL